MAFKLGTKVVGATQEGSNIKVQVENVKKGTQETVSIQSHSWIWKVKSTLSTNLIS